MLLLLKLVGDVYHRVDLLLDRFDLVELAGPPVSRALFARIVGQGSILSEDVTLGSFLALFVPELLF